jgi:hypothetical protein
MGWSATESKSVSRQSQFFSHRNAGEDFAKVIRLQISLKRSWPVLFNDTSDDLSLDIL